MPDQPKSMRLFFIDNQGSWPPGARQVGDLVVWPDTGKYPTYAPIAFGKHPNFDGVFVVQAGNRGVLVSFAHGVKEQGKDLADAMSGKGKQVTQIRIAVDALVHRLVLDMHGEAEAGHDDADPLALLSWLATAPKSKLHAIVLATVLRGLMDDADKLALLTQRLREIDLQADAFTLVDGMLTTIEQTLATSAARAAAAQPVSLKRRPKERA